MPQSTQQIVDSYYNAWKNGGDFSNVPLAEGLRFRGSIDQFENAEQFRAMASQFGPMVKDFTWKAQLANDEYVASFYDFVNTTPVSSLPTAELIRVQDGQITEIDLIYDARELAKVMGR